MTPRECAQLRDQLARQRLEAEKQERLEWRRHQASRAPVQASPQRERAQAALLADPARSDRTLAAKAKTSHVTVAAVRRELEAAGVLDVVLARVDARGTLTCWAARLAA